MQEVFEKIIERLKELQKAFPITSEDEYFRGVGIGYKGAIEAVQQVSTEYNNGWIPVKERLPEEPEETFSEEVTVEELIWDGKINEYNVMIEGASVPTTLYYAGNGYWYDEVNEDYCPVIAWKPLPEPYQLKGE